MLVSYRKESLAFGSLPGIGNRESGIGSRESGFWMNMGVQDLYYVGFWFIVVRVVFVKALEEVDVFVEAWVGWLSWKA